MHNRGKAIQNGETPMTAYVIFMREKTRDPAELAAYREKVPASREGHDMKALARYGNVETMEGAPVEGVVIIEFVSIDAAKAWYNSPAYTAARKHRFLGADYRVVISEGL
jgi:uncharacterized protein (DUF1330 family)